MTDSTYTAQLEAKTQQLSALMAPFNPPELEVFPSPAEHYRMRAEFRIWHEPEHAFFAMFTPGPDKKKYRVETFPPGSTAINRLMPPLIAAINEHIVLKKKLYEVHFLTSTTGDVLVSMIYHKPVDGQWQKVAEALRVKLGITIVGRSKGQKVVLGRDYVTEKFTVSGRVFSYRHSENSFTQPNGYVCRDMLKWASTHSQHIGGDLLELYCGNGNFTLPLSQNFTKVLANEISKGSTADALHNLDQNNIHNVTIVRMSSEELTEALRRKREFRRLQDIDLDAYEFSTVFVDPPRAGLDDRTLEFIAQFSHIMYISCNHHSLLENLHYLARTHRIIKFALFDQFPYTDHIETGVLLQKIDTAATDS